jgi:hypothetical protein
MKKQVLALSVVCSAVVYFGAQPVKADTISSVIANAPILSNVGGGQASNLIPQNFSPTGAAGLMNVMHSVSATASGDASKVDSSASVERVRLLPVPDLLVEVLPSGDISNIRPTGPQSNQGLSGKLDELGSQSVVDSKWVNIVGIASSANVTTGAGSTVGSSIGVRIPSATGVSNSATANGSAGTSLNSSATANSSTTGFTSTFIQSF